MSNYDSYCAGPWFTTVLDAKVCFTADSSRSMTGDLEYRQHMTDTFEVTHILVTDKLCRYTNRNGMLV